MLISPKLLRDIATLLIVVLGHAALLITLQLFDKNSPVPEKVEMLQAELIPPSSVSKPQPPEPKKEAPKPPEKSPPTPKLLAIAPEKSKPLSTPTPEPIKEAVQKKSVSEPTPEATASTQDTKIAAPISKTSQTQGNNEVGVEGGSVKLSQLKMIYKPDTNVFYPRISKDIGEQGTVGVVLYVDETGSVSRTQVLRSSGFKRLDKAAEELCSRIRFSPYLVDGNPTSVSAGISIKFEMNR
jgi:protein TonB